MATASDDQQVNASDNTAESGEVHRAARLFAFLVILDVLAAIGVRIVWPRHVGLFLAGFAMAWLTAVALAIFHARREERSAP